jgi:intracellular multiplication protein IcmP
VADQKGASSDTTLGWMALAVVGLMVLWLIWHFQEYNIKNMIRYIRMGELWLISWFIDDENYFVPYGDRSLNFKQWYDVIGSIPKEQLSGEVMAQISTLAMTPLKYVITFIIVILSFWALFKGPKTTFRSALDINGLIKRQAINFPYIAPFITFNPANQPPRPPGAPVPAELPLFAEALGPEEWLAYYDVPIPDGKLDEDAAARAFSRQLGKPWRGPLHLPPYKQVLLAAFCLKALRKREAADKMLGELSMCWSKDRGLKISSKLLGEARKLLRDKDKIGKILSKCNQHAFENTAMLRGLLTAREEGGVLSPGQFVWLRGHDRSLWYPLNNLGRQAFHPEAIGALAHFKAEKMTERPIPRPKMEEAVKTMSEYITSSNARPIPALDYSNSKKRGIKTVKK